jgi:hypothetical protein
MTHLHVTGSTTILGGSSTDIGAIGATMPAIAIVDGIRMMIFPLDHVPPHIHAFGADFRLKLAIADAAVLEARGMIRPAVLRRLQSWTTAHRDRLGALWLDAAAGRLIGKVEE